MQRALAPLEAEGWRLRHSLPWQGQGDIDSVAIAPSGIAVAIETKTRTYDSRHLARVREQAAWLSRRRRRWARNGALGVLCVVRVRGVERVEHDVLVVSIDRLTHVLRVAAGMDPDRIHDLSRTSTLRPEWGRRGGLVTRPVLPWGRQSETAGRSRPWNRTQQESAA